MAEKIDWAAAKAAYVTGDMSTEMLAQTFGVSKNAVVKRCSAEGWVEARKAYKQNVAQKVAKKTASSVSSTVASALKRSWQAADKIVTIIDREADRMMEAESSPSAKAINHLADSLDKLTGVLRNAGNAPTRLERQQLKISQERLKLEQQKAAASAEGSGGIEITIGAEAQSYAE